MSKKIHRSVIFTKFNPRKDKSATITFETQEQTSEEIGELHGLTGMYGFLIFKAENQLTPEEVKGINSLETEVHGKTKSKRLMNVLFRLHEQQGEGDFDTFYANKMESIINQIKNKLD
jgi:hypothetical protein